ncbi:MAG: DNA polymerase III subunit [Desulfatibacillaceae bacterium]|nr:DNA polymerase III subunit [Desulfatibacillaceae bacterium]
MHHLALQKRVLAILAGILNTRNIPNALLFTGQAGLGQADAALFFAMAQNCSGSRQPESIYQQMLGPKGPCGVCNSCRKILSRNHPAILHIRKDGAFTKIKQVRDLIDLLAFKPFEGKSRVVIFHDAESMNKESANALLKSLEEPPAGTGFVLIAPDKAMLLPTIFSRCQEVRFAPVGQEAGAAFLEEETGVKPHEARLYVRLSQGGLLQARQLANRNAAARWQWLVNTMAKIGSQGPAQALLLAQVLSANKKRFAGDLAWIRLWLADLLKNRLAQIPLPEGSPDTGWDAPYLLELLEKTEALEQHISGNINLRLALEVWLLSLQREHGKSGGRPFQALG